jgi:protoheme ferro-lyase
VTSQAPVWISLVVGAFTFGVSLVAILVARRSLEPAFAVVALSGFAGGAWAFGELSIAYDRFDIMLWGLGFAVATFAGGYALASTLLASLAMKLPELEAPVELPADIGTTALVVVGDIDPEEYEERSTATDLNRLSEEGLLEVSIAILPFLFFAQKARYRAVGGTSPASRQLRSVADHVSAALASSPIDRVDVGRLDVANDLAGQILSLAEAGYRTICVVEAMVGSSLELDEVKRRVDALRLGDLGVHVAYADALWSAERVAMLVANRIMQVADEPGRTGVVLVGMGQPEERARVLRTFDEHETAFLNRVRMLLLDRGLSETFVRLAWADWHTPDVTGAVRHLAALGCDRLVVSPACFPLDTIETLLDVPLSVRQARVDDSVSVVTLSAWSEDPGLVEELRSRALHTIGAPVAD